MKIQFIDGRRRGKVLKDRGDSRVVLVKTPLRGHRFIENGSGTICWNQVEYEEFWEKGFTHVAMVEPAKMKAYLFTKDQVLAHKCSKYRHGVTIIVSDLTEFYKRGEYELLEVLPIKRLQEVA